MKLLTIGEVAKQTGIGVETVRFYEKRGLIDEPPRTEAGYRQYPEDTAPRQSRSPGSIYGRPKEEEKDATHPLSALLLAAGRQVLLAVRTLSHRV